MTQNFQEITRQLRCRIISAASNAGGGHIGGALSIVDLIYYAYSEYMTYDSLDSNLESRDRFILSKGHGCLALYAVLEHFSMLKKNELENFLKTDSRLPGHSEHFHVPHIEITTGSLGHGVGVATGMAAAAKRKKTTWRVICILGDGECNEGSVWESLLFAAQHRLDNLVIVIDSNKLESLDLTENILGIQPLSEKLSAFGLDVMEINGHDYTEIRKAFERQPMGKPLAIVANTVKGKGVSFMENVPKWHYRSPTPEELENALNELKSHA